MIGPRLIAYGVAVAALIGAVMWAVHSLREQGRDEVRAELEPRIEAAEAALAHERADRKRAEDASNAYQREIADLRIAPVDVPVVRLCRHTITVPAAGNSARRSDATAAGPGSDAGAPPADPAPGPDIGPDLMRLALRCDEISAQLRALQSWARNTPGAMEAP